MQIYKTDDVFADGEEILVKKETVSRTKNSHKHEFIELVFISRGGGIQIVDGVEYAVRRGDFLFVDFGSSHAFSSPDMDFVHILLKPEFVSDSLVNSENIFDLFTLPQFSGIPGEFSERCAVSFENESLSFVSDITEAMLSEYTAKRPGYKTALHGYIQVLFTLLIRKLKEIKSDSSDVQKITAYVNEHLTERITLSDIAKNCFYNPSYFSRKFKSIFGKNLKDYIKEKRLERAAEVICTSDVTIDELSRSVGFSDKSKFCKDFKARFSLTPGKYRKSKKTPLK